MKKNELVGAPFKATYIMWGLDGGCEVRAPFGTCLGRLLRLAQSQMTVEYDKDVVGEAKQAMGPKTQVLKSNQWGRLRNALLSSLIVTCYEFIFIYLYRAVIASFVHFYANLVPTQIL